MKKFYNLVALNHHPEGFIVLLDGKPVKTTLGRTLYCPTEALGQAVMAEWMNQLEIIKPETMPLTQILVTCLDHVQDQREAIQATLMNYINTDLICYRSDEEPYAGHQSNHWDPILKWFEGYFGVSLLTTTRIAPLIQDQATHQNFATYLHSLSIEKFTALQIVAAETGSIIIASALVERALAPELAFAAAQAEELLKSEIHHEDFYGKAPEVEKRQNELLMILQAAHVFLLALDT